jgi:hypothetical protein
LAGPGIDGAVLEEFTDADGVLPFAALGVSAERDKKMPSAAQASMAKTAAAAHIRTARMP